MAKWCPILKQKVLYLDCLECEEKNKCNRTEQISQFNNNSPDEKLLKNSNNDKE